MSILLDHQLREQIPHDGAAFPITFFSDELASLPNWGPFTGTPIWRSRRPNAACWTIRWPGTISISSQNLPRGGTAMFAFLALAGDLGATVSPTLVGSLAEMTGGNLKMGLLAGTVFPVILLIGLAMLRRNRAGRLH